ncbi:MAG: glycosyltransferase family 4 protein [Planctomycetales bacterium]|nr:glycosyltransferase family 4 protein [Planctomycetales bacterium]
MKVLYLTNDYTDEIGGISQHVDNLTARVAQEADVAIVYLNVAGRRDDYVDEAGRRVFVVPHAGTAARRMVEFPHRAISVAIAEFEPDLVHVHTPLEAMAFNVPLEIPAIYTNHSSVLFHWGRHTLIRRHMLPRVLRKFTAVICPSQASADRTPHQHVRVIPNGVDVARFGLEHREAFDRPRFFRERLGIQDTGQVVLLTTRRLVKDKRVFELIESNSKFLQENRDDLLLLVSGDGEEFSRIQTYCDEHELTNVRLMGSVEHAEIDQFYYAADFCVIPSQYEVFGISAIEAMACGAVCLVTEVGGLAEIVEHQRSGFYLDATLSLPNTVDVLDSCQLDGVRQAAYDRACSVYSWQSVTQQTIRCYEEAVERVAQKELARSR